MLVGQREDIAFLVQSEDGRDDSADPTGLPERVVFGAGMKVEGLMEMVVAAAAEGRGQEDQEAAAVGT